MKELLFNENNMLSLVIGGCHKRPACPIAPHIMALI